MLQFNGGEGGRKCKEGSAKFDYKPSPLFSLEVMHIRRGVLMRQYGIITIYIGNDVLKETILCRRVWFGQHLTDCSLVIVRKKGTSLVLSYKRP